MLRTLPSRNCCCCCVTRSAAARHRGVCRATVVAMFPAALWFLFACCAAGSLCGKWKHVERGFLRDNNPSETPKRANLAQIFTHHPTQMD
jgi:hypothetical protein